MPSKSSFSSFEDSNAKYSVRAGKKKCALSDPSMATKPFTKIVHGLKSFSASALTPAGTGETHSGGRGQSEHPRDGNE